MRKFALFGASALVLALGVASASAQPSGQQFLTRGQTGVVATHAPSAMVGESRATALEAPAVDALICQSHHASR